MMVGTPCRMMVLVTGCTRICAESGTCLIQTTKCIFASGRNIHGSVSPDEMAVCRDIASSVPVVRRYRKTLRNHEKKLMPLKLRGGVQTNLSATLQECATEPAQRNQRRRGGGRERPSANAGSFPRRAFAFRRHLLALQPASRKRRDACIGVVDQLRGNLACRAVGDEAAHFGVGI